MNDYIDASDLGFDEKFAVGQPVPRAEDPVLLKGAGHYSDDISLPGQAYCVMVRSPYAHGVIRGIDVGAARTMPGVLAVYTGADLAAGGIGPLPPRQVMNNRDGTPMLSPTRYVLAAIRCATLARRSPRSSPRASPPPRTPPRRSSSISIRCRRSASRRW